MPVDFPVVINCRDRVTPVRRLVAWLEHAGVQRICLVDNASTYPPLLDYLDRSPHTVVRLGDNIGQLAPWAVNVIGSHVRDDEYYVETDCDVVPDRRCPPDLFDVLRAALDRFPEHAKAGPALRIDDLPPWYRHRREVIRWERQWWQVRLNPGEEPPMFEAQIDTTFAMYRPGESPTLDRAVRIGFPYVARHLPWYSNSLLPSREDRWYRAHARTDIMTWDAGSLTDRALAHVTTQPEPPGHETSWVRAAVHRFGRRGRPARRG